MSIPWLISIVTREREGEKERSDRDLGQVVEERRDLRWEGENGKTRWRDNARITDSSRRGPSSFAALARWRKGGFSQAASVRHSGPD